MKIGLIPECMADFSLEEVLKICKKYGVEQIELGVGNWSRAPHVKLNELLESEAKRDEMKGLLNDYGISVSAFNCSGNLLAPGKRGAEGDEITRKCFKLSEYFGLDTVVMMSGLPGGSPNDKYPNWVTTSWPPETQEILDYQWNKVAIPYWRELIKTANHHGISKLALEPHGAQLVYNAETFYRLREACHGDKTIGFNLDPSHLFWMGADPIAVIQELKDAIYYVHIKDLRIESSAKINTLLDGKIFNEHLKRSWNFVTPGYGHDELWWNTFIVNLKKVGYDGVLSMELDDNLMSPVTAVEKTVNLLKKGLLD